jgi:pimeloyl-ACP methyl ester carboxylesterase
VTRADEQPIRIDFLDEGAPDGPVALLIMGLGSQRISWPPELIAKLAARGLRVVTMDNRDVGLSTWMSGPEETSDGIADRSPAYTLADMAGDVLALADRLQLGAFHLVGVSMGGMVAQHVAARASDRVQSLGLLMTTAGVPRPGPDDDESWQRLLTPPPSGREAFVDHLLAAARSLGDEESFDEDRLRRRALEHFDRAHNPAGYVRQLLAILSDEDRGSLLADLPVPTLVLHGADDPVVPVEEAHRLHGLLPNSTLEVIEGMRHELAPRLAPRLADAIAGHVLSVESARPRAEG